jgi:para-nitrobenzyl esterase
VFAYRFDWDETDPFLWVDWSEVLGAAHAFEIPFVFGHFNLGRMGRMLWTQDGAESRAALSAAMMSYWAQFAATGDPGEGRDGSQPHWTAWDPAGPKFLVLDTPAGGGIRMSGDAVGAEQLVADLERDQSFASDRERCALLASLIDRTPQLPPDRLARVPGCGAAMGG